MVNENADYFVVVKHVHNCTVIRGSEGQALSLNVFTAYISFGGNGNLACFNVYAENIFIIALILRVV